MRHAADGRGGDIFADSPLSPVKTDVLIARALDLTPASVVTEDATDAQRMMPSPSSALRGGLAALVALLASCSLPAVAAEQPAAELRVLAPGEAVMRARIEEAPDGYRLVIRCESGCPTPVDYAEDVGAVPLGLFQLWDGDGLLLSTWAAASVYVVRAHRLTPQGVRPVLEAASRGAPGLALDGRGRMTVTTSERLGGARDGLRTVVWRWDGTRFRRGA